MARSMLRPICNPPGAGGNIVQSGSAFEKAFGCSCAAAGLDKASERTITAARPVTMHGAPNAAGHGQ